MGVGYTLSVSHQCITSYHCESIIYCQASAANSHPSKH